MDIRTICPTMFSEKAMTKTTEPFLVESAIMTSRFSVAKTNYRAVPNRGIVCCLLHGSETEHAVRGEFESLSVLTSLSLQLLTRNSPFVSVFQSP
jgi:hypothetical protein